MRSLEKNRRTFTGYGNSVFSLLKCVNCVRNWILTTKRFVGISVFVLVFVVLWLDNDTSSYWCWLLTSHWTIFSLCYLPDVLPVLPESWRYPPVLEPWTTLSGSSQWTCLLAGHSQSCWEKSDCLPACHGVRRIESFIISVSQPRHGEGPHSLTDGQLDGLRHLGPTNSPPHSGVTE